jgi:hypothetical protein
LELVGGAAARGERYFIDVKWFSRAKSNHKPSNGEKGHERTGARVARMV